MLLEVGFFPLKGFPRIYFVSYLMGMLSIILHVDFECLLALLSLLGYVEIVIIWLQVSLQKLDIKQYKNNVWILFLVLLN